MAALTTLKQLRDHVASTVRETQISDLIDAYINQTALDLWLFHPWTFRRKRLTFATVLDQEFYNLDSEIDEIAVLRQISTPVRLIYIPDSLFYKTVPNPEDQGSGVPRYYRRWEETGFGTNLAAADTVYVSSSSTSDGSSFTVRIRGRNSSGEVIEETLTLNGTTSVTSTTTWAADGLFQISKSGTTTGTVTCYRTTGATVLAEMEPNNLAPRFIRIGLFPIPSSAVTMYLEYYERFRYLVHNTDVPQMDHKWNGVLLEGTLAKAWEYKQSASLSTQHLTMYEAGKVRMRMQDERNMDYIPVLERRVRMRPMVRRYSDSVSDNFPVYGVGY